jgi:hypothetical protein
MNGISAPLFFVSPGQIKRASAMERPTRRSGHWRSHGRFYPRAIVFQWGVRADLSVVAGHLHRRGRRHW